MEQVFAHSLENAPPEAWQTLEEHSANVAARAAGFAAAFNSAAFGELVGQLHDIGKARKAFQDYLKRSNGLLDGNYDFSNHAHSGVGACWLARNCGDLGRALAFTVAGHHAGLPDETGSASSLSARLQNDSRFFEEPEVARWLKDHPVKLSTAMRQPWEFNPQDKDTEKSMWIRMLHSCLVDADFLDTENFMAKERAELRGSFAALPTLAERFFRKLDSMQKNAAPSRVNALRAKIRAVCEKAAGLPGGCFSLTVPTGGGKTLSGMAFALRHAVRHGKSRIIYVIPYTSIIEQTSEILRDFLGEDQVLEHHSNFDPEKETMRSALAAENYDAPMVVTTSVQFFESLYATRPGKCRKLHNFANSVVILDEVQLLPINLLYPCCEALSQLSEHYNTTILITTATRPDLPWLKTVREIIPPEMHLSRQLKRTQVTMPPDLNAHRQWSEVAAELREYEQVLCIVNTRSNCRELWKLMPEGTLHLSALMCGEHRSKVIAEIKRRLKSGEPVRVISTQVVEAGVDIDFPVVYRALAGLASIMQSAGRCNREGRLAEGKVVVFVPPKPAPLGELRKGEDAMKNIWSPELDFDSPEIFQKYFEDFYSRANGFGEKKFRECLIEEKQFREAEAAFKMIDENSTPVVVRYNAAAEELLERLRFEGANRLLMRKLQRYTVNVYQDRLSEYVKNGKVEELAEGVFAVCNKSDYSEACGLALDGDGVNPLDLII